MSEKYSLDFSLWINQTAQLLREHRWHEVDVPRSLLRSRPIRYVTIEQQQSRDREA
jgi:Domain of unknown function DUF29